MWPRQTASDLSRFHHRRIAEWHQGQLSSYELLELFGVSIEDDPELEVRTIRVDFAPEDGAIADAMRGGERPEWKRMLAQTANETAVLRAAYVPDADADEYASQLFLPAARLREMAEEQHRHEDEVRRLHAEDVTDDDSGSLYSLWQQQEVN